MTRFKFTVYRDSWYRGKGSRHSKLVDHFSDENGQTELMGCCIGHALSDIGVDSNDFRARSEIFEFSEKLDSYQEDEYDKIELISDIEDELIYVNDNRNLDDSERESRLKDIFKSQDIEVEFVDGKRNWNA